MRASTTVFVHTSSALISGTTPSDKRNIVTVAFQEGTLGVTLKRRDDGRVYIERVLANAQAIDSQLSRDDELWTIGGTNCMYIGLISFIYLYVYTYTGQLIPNLDSAEGFKKIRMHHVHCMCGS